MIAIIDYGAGNLMSVKKALDYIGAENSVTDSPELIASADRVILPGVGSFGDAMDSIKRKGLLETVKAAADGSRPFLGICLGLQLLFDESEESPGVEGLGVFKGKVKRFSEDYGLKIPHIGWNDLHITQKNGIFKGIPENSYVYFVHSYYLEAADLSEVAATTQYGNVFHSAVAKGKVGATQFHPEKSGDVGLAILKSFAFGEEF